MRSVYGETGDGVEKITMGMGPQLGERCRAQLRSGMKVIDILRIGPEERSHRDERERERGKWADGERS